LPLPLREIPSTDDLGRLLPGVEPTAAAALLTLLLVSRDLAAATEKFFAGFGISDGKWSVLMLLAASPAKRLRPSELAAQLTVSRATITGLLKGLERDRYVSRVDDRNDGRVDAVRITRSGTALLQKMVPRLARRHAASTAQLSTAECATLIALLRKLRIPVEGESATSGVR
jgi:DNA-binding MarR family transcriptional regulator